jgi:hypothetical protein
MPTILTSSHVSDALLQRAAANKNRFVYTPASKRYTNQLQPSLNTQEIIQCSPCTAVPPVA